MMVEINTKEIMERVRMIYIIRRVFRPLIIECTALCLSLAGVFFLVSIGSVVANANHAGSLVKLFQFFVRAFVGTDPLVQIVFSVAIVSLIAIVISLFKKVGVTRYLA